MEEALIGFVTTELLNSEGTDVGADDELFLDGTIDALDLPRLVNFIESEFQVAVATEDVTVDNFRSIGAMAAYIRGLQGESASLTNAQQLLWTSQQLNPGTPLYNTAYLFTIEGSLDEAAFAAAFARLIEDADTLRTVIAAEDGVPRQAVRSRVEFELPVVDLTGSPDPDAAARLWAQERSRHPLTIEQSTFDSALLRLSAERFAWYFNQHHVVADAWALGLLYQRLEASYSAIRSGRRLELDDPPSFAEYVAYETSVSENAEVAVAGSSRTDDAVPLALYGARPKGGSASNERTAVEVSEERSRALSDLARTPGIQAFTPDLSMFQLLATAFIAYLYRVSGQTRITIGAPLHNRSSADFRKTLGLFMEVYPLEVDVDDDDTFSTLHQRVAASTAELIRSAKPGQASAAANRHINTILNYITIEFGAFDGMPVHAEWIHTNSVDAQHVLRLQVHDYAGSGRFTLGFDCNTDVFDEATRAAVPSHFLRVLDAMLGDWDQSIATVDLLTTEQRATVTSAINPPRAPVEEAPNVVAQLLRRVAETPDAIAINDGDEILTFADVDRLSGSIAAGLEPGSMVGIALSRSKESVLAMVGVLRAGAAYVPIDPTWPHDRISFVAGDAGVDVIIGEEELGLETPTVRFDEAASHQPGPNTPIADDDLAYVLYTSGSTGNPKGVMIEHAALANYVTWASRFYDRGRRLTFPLFTALTFDLTVTSVFVPLVSGGAIRIYRGDSARADLTILDVLEEDAVDIVKLTPSHLALIAETPARSTRIRQLILGGEDLTTAVALRALERFEEGLAIHNEYGPTEATVGCVIHTFDPVADTATSVPIGRPIDGARVYAVDAAGQPVPFGVPGELWIAGRGVARGYAGRPELTATQFAASSPLGEARVYRTGDMVRVRPDGTIEYLGRRDDQVKVRGVRVELGEIEAALASHPAVTATAARLWEQHSDLSAEGVIRCSRCGLASDYPGISFDGDRVCSECRAFDGYEAKARVYFKPESELASLLASQRGKRGNYDCIALLSGGKDSTYVLCRLVDMGLHVLALTLDNGYISDQAKANIGQVVDALGVDHRYVTTPAMNEIFVDSLQRHANVCNGCFKTIYTLSMQTALEEDIPFIVTGLSRGQFFETRLTADLFTELTVSSEQIDANVLEARKAYHHVDDAVNQLLDVSMFDDDRVFEAVQFVDFYRYVDVGLEELYAYLDERVPWMRPTDTGRSTNCLINDVGIYYHRKVRGYHNYALPYSWDVRIGHKTRDAALEELDDDIDVAAVSRILDEIGFPTDVTSSDSGKTLVSYYAAPVEIPTPELKEHMGSKLPQQLIPSQFVRLDAIPLTTNGKVDREALPSPDRHRPEMQTTYVAPQSENEITLARIWEQVLGLDGIGIRDNYFDLGGDSIAAVQIIARAHRHGLPITMNELADALTIENLAAVAGDKTAVRAERVVGDVELTPIQRWLFDEVADPGHFHHVARVALPRGTDSTMLSQALAALADHHDALRQSFRRTDGAWTSSVSERVSTIPLDVVQLNGQPPEAAVGGHPTLLAPFELAEAPLMRGAVLDAPNGNRELVLVAHHLIVDAVSWSHLIDDLGHLIRGLADEAPAPLPAVTTSLRDWAGDLVAAATQVDAEPWQRVAAVRLPTWEATDPGAGEWKSRQLLPPDRTARLLSRASDLGLGIDEVLAAGVASALSASLKTERVRLFVEGHGRESDSAEVDVTRTMGWFTSLYPVMLEVPDSADRVRRAVAMGDQLRRSSRAGREYGLLRYLHPDEAVRTSVALDHREHLVLNYLGRVARAGAEEEDLALVAPIELSRPAGAHRIFGVEVTAYIEDDALTVDWSAPADGAGALQSMADRLVDELESFIEGSSGVAEPFPLAGLDAEGMSDLAAALRSTDGKA